MAEQTAEPSGEDGFAYDIFVSYSSADRHVVERYVERFRQAKLRVWWDQFIYEGKWGAEIEAALNASRRVLVFVSKSAIESGYVFVEARRAREKNKLVPIRIDTTPLKFEFEGLLALIQQWSLHDLQDWEGDERIVKLCSLCGGDTTGKSEQARMLEPAQARARTWLDQADDVDSIAEALAVAVLETEPYATVLGAAEPLRNALRKLTSTEQKTALSVGRLTRGRDKTLKLLDAEIYPVTPPRLKIKVDCVRFHDESRSHALLYLVWETVDELRQPLADWLDTLARLGDVNLRYRVAVAVGVLAQRAFPSVFDGLIGRWALDDIGAMRQCADLALSIAALAPEVEDAVSSVLIKDWSSDTASAPQLRAAIEIACGSTGFRLAPQAIAILKRIAQRDRDHTKLLNDARKAVTNLIAMAGTSDGDALFDLPAFLSALVDWAEGPEDRQQTGHVALALLLSALRGLPVGDPAGGPSLARLLGDREKPPGAEMRQDALDACARAFKLALSRQADRDFAQTILREWAEHQKQAPCDPDPVLRLARAVIGSTGEGTRDRRRVEFLFRRYYAAALGLADMDQGDEA